MPAVRFIFHNDRHAFLSKTTIVGFRGSCAHWRFCISTLREEGFNNPATPAEVRVLALFEAIHNSSNNYSSSSAMYAHPRVPVITLVQREKKTRSIANLNEVVSAIKAATGVTPNVVDFASMPVTEQIRTAHDTDILVLIHGGALAQATFLPPGAALVDIYPYNFPVAYGSELVHWVRRALPDVGLLHHPFEIIESSAMKYKKSRLSEGCQCPGTFSDPMYEDCAWNMFWSVDSIHVDQSRFHHHMTKVVKEWKSQTPSSPALSRKQFQTKARGQVPWYWNMKKTKKVIRNNRDKAHQSEPPIPMCPKHKLPK